MKQYFDIKSEYQDCIVLFRMGDFFETFNEDAKLTAKILGIVLTKRANGAAADVPLAGFPHHALDNYLPKLVNAGHRVAICEQVEDPKNAKGVVKREVIEVITPGTITSDQVLGHKSNAYIGSVFPGDKITGYSILDKSTGEFYIGECENKELEEILDKFSPREVVVSEVLTYSTLSWYRKLKPFITKIDSWIFSYEQGYKTLTQHFKTHSLKGFGCEDITHGIIAGGALFYHILKNLSGKLDHVSRVQAFSLKGTMALDSFTIRNLEVFKSLATQGTHGTLLDILDRTLTAGGGRRLKNWIQKPLLDIGAISWRHGTVADFIEKKQVLHALQEALKHVIDIERTLGKISKGSATPRDVLALGHSLDKIIEINSILENGNSQFFNNYCARFVDTTATADLILKTLDPEPSAQVGKGRVIAKGINEDLDELRGLAQGGKTWLKELQETERKKYEIPSLKIGFNKVFGYYIEITKSHQEKVPETYIRKQTLVNSERYITPELKEYEEKILAAETGMEDIESGLFKELNQKILVNASEIQGNARNISELDVLSSFAELAVANDYIRPEMTDEPLISLNGARHPVVEKLLPATERFIPNDLNIDARTNQIHLITGPNMAGKSTFLRQIGLLVIMAQAGSFIPAARATIGVVDRLFTRVGASDNLAGGESTFLVEMNEAANILNNATAKSLVLLDEIGRGTATYDGLSLAWAITEYLHNNPDVAARTLFATHYHELTTLDSTLERLENHHVEVREFGEKIVFLRKIMPGAGDKSYGIHVAKMAGLPDVVIRRATEILHHHLSSEDNFDPAGMQKQGENATDQLALFAEQESRLKMDLQDLDINSITPLEALKKLDELKNKHGL